MSKVARNIKFFKQLVSIFHADFSTSKFFLNLGQKPCMKQRKLRKFSNKVTEALKLFKK